MRCLLAALAMIAAPAVAWADAPPPCPSGVGVVERTSGPPLIYLGADPANPEACRILRDGSVGLYWFGSWKTDWPGADKARDALRTVYAKGPRAAVRFDTVAAPGYSWHETIRNDGFEDLNVAGAVRRTMKVTHEREGFGGNTYHSIITQWKELGTNMTVYQTYIHVAGQPEPGAAWNSVTIFHEGGGR